MSGLLLVLTLLPALGWTAELRQGAPAGKRVDIGGRTIHLVCTGSGQPTVVFEAGGGQFSEHWSPVQDSVSSRVTACSYDRAGLGSSDEPAVEPHTMAAQVLDLHAVLMAAAVPAPYILVGHSTGGLLVRLYAERYPNEVAALVMVDPTDESFRGYVGSPGSGRWARIRDGLQANELNPARAAFSRELQEMHDLREDNPAPLGTRPLIVLIGGRKTPPPLADTPEDMWAELQAANHELMLALARLSQQSKVVVDPTAGHNLHMDHPQLVVLAIAEVLDVVRDGKTLQEYGPTNALVDAGALEDQP